MPLNKIILALNVKFQHYTFTADRFTVEFKLNASAHCTVWCIEFFPTYYYIIYAIRISLSASFRNHLLLMHAVDIMHDATGSPAVIQLSPAGWRDGEDGLRRNGIIIIMAYRSSYLVQLYCYISVAIYTSKTKWSHSFINDCRSFALLCSMLSPLMIYNHSESTLYVLQSISIFLRLITTHHDCIYCIIISLQTSLISKPHFANACCTNHWSNLIIHYMYTLYMYQFGFHCDCKSSIDISTSIYWHKKYWCVLHIVIILSQRNHNHDGTCCIILLLLIASLLYQTY